jgi:hypothetical protein
MSRGVAGCSSTDLANTSLRPDVTVRFGPSFSGRFQFVSRTKEAVYRESGEADYDEAGSPETAEPETGRSDEAPENAVTQLSEHRKH